MFRYLPQSGTYLRVICLGVVNSCCGELKYANFSEINSSLPPARVCVIWNLTIAYGPLRVIMIGRAIYYLLCPK